MLDGKKTLIGAIFVAATFAATGFEPVLSAKALIVAKATLGTIGAFLSVYGIGDKVQKLINK